MRLPRLASNSLTKNSTRLRLLAIAAAALIFAAVPVTAYLQNLAEATTSTTRPDILWMRGGTGDVENTVYSPDGQMIAVSSVRQIKIIRASDGVLLQTINQTYISIYKPMAFSPDNQTIAVAGEIGQPQPSQSIQIWRLSDKTMIRSIPISDPNSVVIVNFSPDGTKIIAGLHIYNVSDGSIYFDTGNVNIIPTIYSPDGQYIYGASTNGSTGATAVVRWNGANPTTPTTIETGNSGRPVDISPNGQYVVTLSSRVVRVSDGVLVAILADNGHFVFSPDGQYIAGAYVRGGVGDTFTVYRTSNWSVLWTATADQPTASVGGSISFSPDSQSLAVSTLNTRLLNASNGSLIRNLTTLKYAPVYSLAFSTDEQTLATATDNSVPANTFGTIQLWNVADGSRRNVTFTQSVGLGINQIFITPDNQKLVTLDGARDSNNIVSFYVRFWNANDGSLIKNVSVGSFNRIDIALSPDMQTYACDIGTTSGGAVDFYNASNDTLIRRVDYVGFGNGSAYSPDSQLLAVSGGGFNTQVKLIRVSDGTVLPQTLNLAGRLSGLPSDMVFSSDNQTIAVTEATGDSNTRNGIIELFRVSDGALLRTFGTFDNWGASVAFSPDGQTVIGTGQDATVRIWRVSDGALLQTYDKETYIQPSGGSAVLWQVAYSPDGSRFAYGRQDATVVMARNPYPTTPPTNYTISGQITRNSSALSGVTVALSGSTSGTTTTDISGNYSFTVTDGGSYTVTPTLSGNTFAPSSRNFNFIAGNQTADFTGSLVTYAISGNVQSDGANLPGATVSLSGSQSLTATTDANGNYSFTAYQGGNYTISVSKNGYAFAPASQTLTNLQANQIVNFQSANNTAFCAPAPSGLAAWYKGEGNGSDSSGNSNTLDLVNGLTFAAGKVGQAFSFDGINDYATTPTSNNSHQTSAITLDVWAKPSELKLQTLISKYSIGGSTANRAFLLDTDTSGTKIIFTVYQSPDAAVAKKYQTTNAVLLLNVMTHIAATFDTATQQMHIYINGADVPTTLLVEGNVTTINDPNVQLRLGTLRDSGGNDVELFHGLLDEAQIYNRALSQTEIQNIYNAGSAGVCGISNSTGAGLLDTTFNGTGKVTTPIGSSDDFGYSTAIQADGKIVVAGSVNNGSNQDFGLVRYNTDGTLDTTFGTGGKVTTAIGGSDDVAYSMAIQTDGKIVAAGYTHNSNDDFAVVRYNTNGSLDTTFGTNGKVVTALGGSDDDGYTMTIQPDGKIIVAGATYTSGNHSDFGLVRYNTDGALDATFGSGGKVLTTVGGLHENIGSLAIQSDGKIVAVGSGDNNGSNYDVEIVRYNANGSIDGSFNGTGKIIMPIGGSDDHGRSVTLQTDGKIVVAGDTYNGSNYDFVVVRFNIDGSLDTSFNSTGKVITPIGNADDSPNSVKIQTDGRIVAAGFSDNGSNKDFAVVRYNTNGALDTTFGTFGKVTTPIGNSTDNGSSAFLQTDGKIVVAGFSNNGSNSDFAVVRYIGSASGAAQGSILTSNGSNVNIAPVSSLNLTFASVTQSGYTAASPLSSSQLPALPNGYTLPANAPMYDIRTSAGYSGNITVSFAVSGVADAATCARLRSLHFESGAWTANVNATPSYNSSSQVCTVAQTVTSLSPFVVALGPLPTFSISGRVTSDGTNGINGVTVNLSGTSSASVTTDSSGNYSFGGLASGGSFTVTPQSTAVYNFIAQSVNNLAANQTVNFTGALRSYVIGGQVKANGNPLSGVNVALSGGASSSVVTDSSGNYSFSIAAGGSYMVTPSLANYTFAPVNASFSGVSASQTANFAATLNCTYSINPTSASAPGAGGGGSVTVTAPTGCAWTAASSDSWLTVTSGASGSGNGTVSYTAAANSGASRIGTLTIAGKTLTVTQGAGCLTVSLPVNQPANGAGVLTVPVNVADTSGRGVNAYDFTLTFDPAVLQPVAAAPVDASGTLSGGFTVTPNVSTTGQLTVSGFGTSPLTGAGTLLNLKFNVVGAGGAASSLNWSNFVFNEGDPCATALNGSVSVVKGSVAGKVIYGTTPSTQAAKFVPNAALTANGTPQTSTASNSTGDYLLSNLGGGNYTVTPSKSGDVNAITSFDASMVARHVAGLIQLNASQQIAADATNNGIVSSLDAARIAQTAAGITNSGIAGQWKFTPSNKTYSSTNTALTGEDYTAILVGEVSGNWTAPAPLAFAAEAKAEVPGTENAENFEANGNAQAPADIAQSPASPQAVNVSLPANATSAKGNVVIIPVTVGDLTNQGVLSYDFNVQFDSTILQPDTTPTDKTGTLSQNFTVTPNAAAAGNLTISGFGTTELTGAGTLLNLRFKVVGNGGQQTPLTFQTFVFNEGDPAATISNGQFTVMGTTAAAVSIGGRVTTRDGRGIANVRVTMTDREGKARTALTNPFGNYRFSELTAGESYVVTVTAKRYRFSQSSQLVNAVENLGEINFSADGN